MINIHRHITLEDIKNPVEEAVSRYHKEFDELLKSRSKWLGRALELLSQSTGKQVRPILTTLVAGMIKGQIPDLAVTSGILLELIHTATLIHDDVIDEAKTRRGQPTLGVIFDNRIAVLMGDFILSSALIGALQTRNLRIIGIISKIGKELTEGEIRQYETAEEVVLNEALYMDIIQQKTAILFESCAEVAAIAVEASEREIEQAARIGHLIGLAFQIRDDIFDYYDGSDIGKPTGNDIREGKITLPLLHCLLVDQGETSEGAECLRLIREKQFDDASILRLISFTKDRGGITYAEHKMIKLISEAKQLISTFPDSPYREALLLLADYIALRNK